MPGASNFSVNTNLIVEAIRHYYPATINDIEQNKRYNYISLFGVRIDTCDTSKADDVIGCIWMNALGVWSSLIFAASTDPSPYYIDHPESAAAKAGGTAWVMPGQYLYYLGVFCGASHSGPCSTPAFIPKSAIPVYRMPAGQGLDVSVATVSTSNDTLIHRSWGTVAFKKDSAGCNLLKNMDDLNKMAQMAREHIKKYGVNAFQYTLLTREQIEAIPTAENFGPIILLENMIYNFLKVNFKFGLR